MNTTPFNLDDHARKLALAGQPEETIKIIRRIFGQQSTCAQPASRSMPSLQWSAKMQGAICPTGSNIELVFQMAVCEWDDTVVGYVTQTEDFPLEWMNADGTKDAQNHRPDFLILKAIPSAPPPDWVPATFVEAKHTSELINHVKSGHGRYVFDEVSARWRCPAAEEVVKKIYNFGYEVITQENIDHLKAGNVEYLHDYMKANTPKVPTDVVAAVKEYVTTNQGCTIADVLAEVGGVSIDRFFTMVVRGQIFVPMDEEDFRQFSKVRVYTDPVVAEAHRTILRTQSSVHQVTRPPLLQAGEQLVVDHVTYDVLDGSGEVVRLRDDALGIKPMRRDHLFRLHRDGRLHSLGIQSEQQRMIRSILQGATTEQLVAGMDRLHRIDAYLTSGKRRAAPGEPKLTPTDRYWLAKARDAVRDYGVPLVGCIDRIKHRGTRDKVVCGAREEVIQNAISKYYLIPEPRSKQTVYHDYKELCKKESVAPVSYKTFFGRVAELLVHEVAKKREGEMASWQHAPPSIDEPSIAAKAKYFMHVAQMDEYVFDVATIDPEFGRCLGQLWVVVMIDVYTRTVLAFHVTFDEPTYALTTLPTLRKCVLRWKRCPRCILTDRGPGFKNEYAQALVRLGVRPTWRPAGMGRAGAQVERFGGVSNQRLAKELQGHTGIFAKFRRVSKSHDPAELAVNFPAEISAGLDGYFFQVYDELPHGGLNNRSPREVREISQQRDGERKHLQIEADSAFDYLSLPTPRGDGTAAVQEHNGVQHDGLYYWHPKFAETAFIGSRVQMCWDPCDITHVFAYIGDKWERCECLALRELSRLPREELCLASVMIRRQRKEYKRSGPESVAAIQKLLGTIRKTESQVQELLRMRESVKQLTLSLPPISLTTESTKPAHSTENAPAGFPASYLEGQE